MWRYVYGKIEFENDQKKNINCTLTWLDIDDQDLANQQWEIIIYGENNVK